MRIREDNAQYLTFNNCSIDYHAMFYSNFPDPATYFFQEEKQTREFMISLFNCSFHSHPVGDSHGSK